MAQAETTETLSVDRDALFDTITKYDEYPQFVAGCKSVKVDRADAGRARCAYQVSMIKEVRYTVDLVENRAAGTVEWTLVESDFMKKNTGRWKLESAGPGKTRVTYALEVEFKVPVPSLILNRLVKGSLPTMIREFEERAKRVSR